MDSPTAFKAAMWMTQSMLYWNSKVWNFGCWICGFVERKTNKDQPLTSTYSLRQNSAQLNSYCTFNPFFIILSLWDRCTQFPYNKPELTLRKAFLISSLSLMSTVSKCNEPPVMCWALARLSGMSWVSPAHDVIKFFCQKKSRPWKPWKCLF